MYDDTLRRIQSEGVPCARGCGVRFFAGWATLNQAAMDDHEAVCPKNPDGITAQLAARASESTESEVAG